MIDRHERIHVDEVRPGDTVTISGVLRTVCGKDICFCPFMGRSLFGDTFNSGQRPVTRVTFGAELGRRSRELKTKNEKGESV